MELRGGDLRWVKVGKEGREVKRGRRVVEGGVMGVG